MNNECQNCKHARLWTDAEQKTYIDRFYDMFKHVPTIYDRYYCDKIPKGKEWTEDGSTYKYDGYSLDGECYDEVFHCFEPKESKEE